MNRLGARKLPNKAILLILIGNPHTHFFVSRLSRRSNGSFAHTQFSNTSLCSSGTSHSNWVPPFSGGGELGGLGGHLAPGQTGRDALDTEPGGDVRQGPHGRPPVLLASVRGHRFVERAAQRSEVRGDETCRKRSVRALMLAGAFTCRRPPARRSSASA